MSRKPRSYISKKQKEALVDFIENHPILNKQRYDINTLTYKQAAKLWNEAAQILNAIPGAWKPWMMWRKCWQDIKNDVRQKLCRQKKYEEEEGGKESKITLSEIEERISILVYEVHISDHQHVPESAVNLLSNTNVSNNSDPEINVDQICVHMPLPRKRYRNVSAQLLTRKLNITAKNVQRLTRTLHTASWIARNIKEKNSIKRKYCAKKLELLERLVKAKENSNDTKIRIAETNERSLDVELQIAAGIEKIGESLSNIENVLKINQISLVI